MRPTAVLEIRRWNSFELTRTTVGLGRSEPHLIRVSKIWARIHNTSAKLPSVFLLALSGFTMNFVVSWVS